MLSLARLTCHSRARLAAENLFLRKQLAMYVERGAAHRRADDATRVNAVALSYLTNWRELLLVVTPDTLIRWHRLGVPIAAGRSTTHSASHPASSATLGEMMHVPPPSPAQAVCLPYSARGRVTDI